MIGNYNGRRVAILMIIQLYEHTRHNHKRGLLIGISHFIRKRYVHMHVDLISESERERERLYVW